MLFASTSMSAAPTTVFEFVQMFWAVILLFLALFSLAIGLAVRNILKDRSQRRKVEREEMWKRRFARFFEMGWRPKGADTRHLVVRAIQSMIIKIVKKIDRAFLAQEQAQAALRTFGTHDDDELTAAEQSRLETELGDANEAVKAAFRLYNTAHEILEGVDESTDDFPYSWAYWLKPCMAQSESARKQLQEMAERGEHPFPADPPTAA